MAKKQVIDEKIAVVKKAIQDNKLIIGTDNTIKELKKGKLAKVFISSNCPKNIRALIDEYVKITGTEIVQLDYANDEFSIVCKKPFSISIAGLIKE